MKECIFNHDSNIFLFKDNNQTLKLWTYLILLPGYFLEINKIRMTFFLKFNKCKDNCVNDKIYATYICIYEHTRSWRQEDGSFQVD